MAWGASVADITALKAIDTTGRPDGLPLEVASKRAWYYLAASSSATADDEQCIAPTTGPGRWLKLGIGFNNFQAAQVVAPVSIAYAATITIDCNLSNTFVIGTLTGNITVNITNLKAGQAIAIEFTQDTTGSRLVTWQAGKFEWAGGTAATLSTGASKRDRFYGHSFDGVKLDGALRKDVR
jgi:hypothetical protein